MRYRRRRSRFGLRRRGRFHRGRRRRGSRLLRIGYRM